MGVNSLPNTVTRQRRGCDLNPGPSAPEYTTITTRLLSHINLFVTEIINWNPRCSLYANLFEMLAKRKARASLITLDFVGGRHQSGGNGVGGVAPSRLEPPPCDSKLLRGSYIMVLLLLLGNRIKILHKRTMFADVLCLNALFH